MAQLTLLQSILQRCAVNNRPADPQQAKQRRPGIQHGTACIIYYLWSSRAFVWLDPASPHRSLVQNSHKKWSNTYALGSPGRILSIHLFLHSMPLLTSLDRKAKLLNNNRNSLWLLLAGGKDHEVALRLIWSISLYLKLPQLPASSGRCLEPPESV